MSESYFSLNSQIENKAPLNNLTSHISTSYIKWETRNGKWETRSGKWEIRNLEVGYGKGLNWAPRNGKWEPNQNSRLWRFALCAISLLTVTGCMWRRITRLRVNFQSRESSFDSHFPFLRAQFNPIPHPSCNFLISYFSFLISYFSFLTSHFQLLGSHFM